MERESFINICQAVEHGGERYVCHRVSRESGRVVECHGESLAVQLGGRQVLWAVDECEPPDLH